MGGSSADRRQGFERRRGSLGRRKKIDRRTGIERRTVAERRLRARFRVRIPFTLRSDAQSVRGTTRNVSLLGISAYSQGSLPLSQHVQCVLELSQQPPISVTVYGTVIRCTPLPEANPDGTHETGVFFKEFEKKGEVVLTKHLDQIAENQESAIQQGYQALKQKLAERKRRKRLEQERKRRRKQLRLRRQRQRLARQKRSGSGRSKQTASLPETETTSTTTPQS